MLRSWLDFERQANFHSGHSVFLSFYLPSFTQKHLLNIYWIKLEFQAWKTRMKMPWPCPRGSHHWVGKSQTCTTNGNTNQDVVNAVDTSGCALGFPTHIISLCIYFLYFMCIKPCTIQYSRVPKIALFTDFLKNS